MVGIACGGLHNAVYTEQGQVFTWGCADDGSIGRTGEESMPMLVDGLTQETVVGVACGDGQTIVVTANGVRLLSFLSVFSPLILLLLPLFFFVLSLLSSLLFWVLPLDVSLFIRARRFTAGAVIKIRKGKSGLMLIARRRNP